MSQKPRPIIVYYLHLYNPNGPANCPGPDPSLNYNAALSTGEPNFEMGKIYIYIVAVQIVARLRTVMPDYTVLSLKNLVQFR